MRRELKLVELVAMVGCQRQRSGDWYLLLWLPSEKRWLR